jgi:DNA-binding response OmpR family regulator
VLLVDDNADMRTYVRRLLAERYYVTAVASGRTALETLRARRFDLVLAEVALGDNDGLELLHRLRTEAHERAIPVVLLSAVAQSTPTLRGLAAGAQDYIVKPFTARELIARIDAQLALGGLHPAGTEP